MEIRVTLLLYVIVQLSRVQVTLTEANTSASPEQAPVTEPSLPLPILNQTTTNSSQSTVMTELVELTTSSQVFTISDPIKETNSRIARNDTYYTTMSPVAETNMEHLSNNTEIEENLKEKEELMELMELCDNHCNCNIQHTTLRIICSRGVKNNNTQLHKSNFNGEQIEFQSIDDESNVMRNEVNESLRHYNLTQVTQVQISAFEGNESLLLSLLSELTSLTETVIQNSTISTTELTKHEVQLPWVSSLTLKHVVFTGPEQQQQQLQWYNSAILSSHPQLHELRIVENQLNDFQTCAGLKQLEVIDISRNRLVTLNSSCLSEQRSLVKLNAARNQLIDGSLGCDTNTHHILKKLDLAFNSITSVESILCPDGLLSLEYLDLSYNLINYIQHDTFEPFKNLLQLDLDHNLIETIESNIFGCGLASIQRLSLVGNQIKHLDASILYPLQNLREINLSSNLIAHVKSHSIVGNMSQYGNTHCLPSYNLYGDEDSIEYLLEQMSMWSHLVRVDLSHNNLTHLDSNLFKTFLKHTKNISLAYNHIESLPRYGLENLQRLEIIDLSHNNINWLDVGSFTNQRLKNIDLSYNKLKKLIRMTFLYLPSLQNLNLSHNKLSYFYKMAFYKMCKFGQTVTLDMSHNHLTEDVIWTSMTSFSDVVEQEHCHVRLLLNHNRIKYPLTKIAKKAMLRAVRNKDIEQFTKWAHLRLKLRNNPLQCDCQLYRDVKIISDINQLISLFDNDTDKSNHTRSMSFIDLEDVYCAAAIPSVYMGKSLDNILPSLQAHCEGNTHSETDKQVDCVGQMERESCKEQSNSTNILPILLCIGLLVIILICSMYGMKRSGLISKIHSKYNQYRKYNDQLSCAYGHTITAHYHADDTTLVQSELSYFLEECCPEHTVELRLSDDNECDVTSDSTHLLCHLHINLFIISRSLMQQIKVTRELNNYYDHLIEQEAVAIFLFMDSKREMESIHPTFCNKLKHRQNVYSISGQEKLEKLQSVLNSATANGLCDHETAVLY